MSDVLNYKNVLEKGKDRLIYYQNGREKAF